MIPITAKAFRPTILRTKLTLAAIALVGVLCPGGFAVAQATPNRAANAAPANAAVQVLHVRGNIYMLSGAGGNITVQVGDDGVLLVDAGLPNTSDKVYAAIRTFTDKPIHYIIDTHVHVDHVGGNGTLAKLGNTVTGGNVVGNIGADATNQATIIAFQTVLDRMSAPTGKQPASPEGDWPTDTYTTSERKLFFNNEGIEIIHIPDAHTDGDSLVFFRRSDVISTGDIYVTNGYPIIDLQRGGNIQGVIAGLNRLVDICIPKELQEGGTMLIPGHGRVSDVADLVFYQEMVTIIRDRIQAMVNQGMTLEQVKAAKPTSDYDPEYGKSTGFWTTDMFVSAIYKNLSDAKH
jgi:cyclase